MGSMVALGFCATDQDPKEIVSAMLRELHWMGIIFGATTGLVASMALFALSGPLGGNLIVLIGVALAGFVSAGYVAGRFSLVHGILAGRVAGLIQFFAIATKLMIRVLMDYHRRRKAAKRGGDQVQVSLDVDPDMALDQTADDGEELEAVVAALEKLEKLDSRKAEAGWFVLRRCCWNRRVLQGSLRAWGLGAHCRGDETVALGLDSQLLQRGRFSRTGTQGHR